MKSKNYCSVCKQWLDMEVVTSGDSEDDDGVTWYRCPGCQGFLPKLNAGAEDRPADAPAALEDEPVAAAAGAEPVAAAAPPIPDEPTDPLAELPVDLAAVDAVEETVDEKGGASGEKATEEAREDATEPPEPVAEYAAMLAEADVAQARPYRPWDTYAEGDCILHLAWNDCGIVVGKEKLPGGRHVIKVFFSEAGVVRLIENAPQ